MFMGSESGNSKQIKMFKEEDVKMWFLMNHIKMQDPTKITFIYSYFLANLSQRNGVMREIGM